ncbi:hypothetical protein [Streptomyces poonensis]|uniref:Uncharacterized protein n=1 Tax=Streptomyces poonensis TaxID=68255 RepID=A0A918PNE0_9ACTN|nr:hypothetical protein [Streptomyces poonensis]GGZ15660.1 hypothetical protein GCM10010365_39360 [Streptomyces poonensis]GLJ91539.1 hypothetical protein GCM10017589_41460 [Streptomyces poonensis]
MPDLIVQLLTWVLNLCLPRPRGRHRAGHLPAPPAFLVPPPPPRFTERLDGSASALVRPYVLTVDAWA